MAWNPFRRDQTTRHYPAAGIPVTGPAGRFRRSKTIGARAADRAAADWEQADRQAERQRRGPWTP